MLLGSIVRKTSFEPAVEGERVNCCLNRIQCLFHCELDARICICLIIRSKIISFVVHDMEPAIGLKYEVNKSNQMTIYGLVFALPFVALSLFPKALEKLPNSGAWMETLKISFGFIEIAAAI